MQEEIIIEIIGAAFALIYLFLEIRQQRMMWVVGFISSAFYVYIFLNAKFYAYMGLYIYYILASIYGWVLWSKRTAVGSQQSAVGSRQLVVSSLLFKNSKFKIQNSKLIALLLLYSALLFVLFTFILSAYTDSAAPVGEALATALSIVATWMLAKKILEQWWVWLFVNLLTMALSLWQGLYPTAILFGCYTVASVIGYYKWKKSMKIEDY
ncbi:MAG: nicotinamide riboside transporter PnuC [Prevotellaceae bacterium]|jgi:nicotinamide mononucleotide transporter|nr:nicotinamide riboside transporter PnuC [Prevotellaceae bacterium]